MTAVILTRKNGCNLCCTIHEGADARKIEEKYLTGQIRKGSWKVEENRMIKKQNALLQKVITTFGKVSGALSIWKEWLNDIRRKQRSNSHDGSNDYTDRGTAEYHGRAASNLAGYRRTADTSGRKDSSDTATYRRESAMAGISTEIKQREQSREHSSLEERLEEKKELLQSEKEKTHAAEIMTEECQDKLRQAEQERYDTQREKLAGRYKAKTAMYEALMFLLIWYSVSTTLFQIILSKIFISDCVDKDNIANQSAISLIIRATGICWNQVVCKGMARNKGISLKQKYRYFIGTICLYFCTNIYYHISTKGESI